MKLNDLLTLLTCFALASTLQAGDLPENHEINGYQTLYALEAKEAKRFGEELANQDFKKGIKRICVYGLRGGPSKTEALLAEKYKIHHVPVAGCIVSEGIVEGSKAYNQTMKAHLLKSLGKDVFAEVRQEVEAALHKESSS